jgi:hypothetical protein
MTDNQWLIIAGSRNWFDWLSIEAALKHVYNNGARFMRSGACPTGADAMCELIWGQHVGPNAIERYPADWGSYGKSAGYQRNAEMVNDGAGQGLAFILNDSRGATHTAELMQSAGIKLITITMAVPTMVLENMSGWNLRVANQLPARHRN